MEVKTPEKTFFHQDGVTVTNYRFVAPGQTYAMSGVTSAFLRRKRPPKKGAFLLIGPGLLLVLVALVNLSASGPDMVLQETSLFLPGGLFGLPVLVTLATGGLLAGWGLIRWLTGKPHYVVLLHSASGESEAFTSGNAALAADVVEAVGEAIAARAGRQGGSIAEC